MNLNAAQLRALWLASERHAVVIGKGYGRDAFTENAVAAGTWKKLVLGGLLTPHDTGQPWKGQALRVERGRHGWLTEAGREVVRQGIAHAEAEAARCLGNANAAKERGHAARAERLYDESGEWLDLANEMRGRGAP